MNIFIFSWLFFIGKNGHGLHVTATLFGALKSVNYTSSKERGERSSQDVCFGSGKHQDDAKSDTKGMTHRMWESAVRIA
ncbi:Uncharacterised protein [Leminorella richardii]|uniref:Uncharacterized protein n=1 Tax=Leminorella richardii TaxID=158841 RepID=A0A2X4U5J7_9GAMM|nr:hypothetical protein [Leminorella richardii]SQI33919.1 Uncharacterised protein [Leminorella richardii]